MRWEDVLLQQAGLVSREQASLCGVSPRAVRGRIARGLLLPVHPGVYLDAGHRLDDTAAVLAAVLWGGTRSVVDGPGSALLHGLLPTLPAGRPVGLTVPRATRRRAPDGIRLRRRDLDREDRARVRGIGVTAVALTVLESALAVSDPVAFVDRALQQRRLTFAQLYDAYCRAIGTADAARALPILVAVADRADSRLERRVLALFRQAGVTGYVRALPFGDWMIDIAFPGERVAIEIDGFAFHSGPDRFQTDRTKQNALVASGWTVLRFTWRDVTERPAQVVAQVRYALRRPA